jgi:hypothetical protein
VALREFVDNKGVAWRVWDVTPDKMHPVTARELFLGEYQEGWLAFESAAERRRLSQWPDDWAELPRERLVVLLEQAAPVARRAETDTGVRRRYVEGETLARETGAEDEPPADHGAED